MPTILVRCPDCPAGRFSQFGANRLEDCEICGFGKFSVKGATYCNTVEAGRKVVTQNGFRVGDDVCPRNTYSIGATDNCTNCEGGHSDPGSASCISTPPGHYYNGTTDIPCVAGKFSASGAPAEDGCSLCSEGKYSAAGAAFCITAEAGKKVLFEDGLRVNVTDCSINTFSTGATDNCTNCEGGHSDPGSASCISTSPGYYYDGTTDIKCPAGKFSATGASDAIGCLSCSNGKYSIPGSAYCSTAEAGKKIYFEGDLRVGVRNCEMNTFSAGAEDECLPCLSGHSDPGSSSCIDTAPGYYYNGTTDIPCVAGKFSASGAPAEDGCSLCSEGKYSAAGAAFCITAEAGKKVLFEDGLRVNVTDCSINTFSTGATDNCTNCEDGGHSGVGSSSCSSSPPGYYYDGTTEIQCPAGKFSANGGLCRPCNRTGEYSRAGAAYCSVAGAGRIPTKNRTTTEPCPIHTYSVGASDYCEKCIDGHASIGSASCQTTPNGHYYQVETERDLPCREGTWSTGANNVTGCIPCSLGFVSNHGSGYCDVCQPGTFSNENRTRCIQCPKGSYSGVGAHQCKSCEASKFNDESGKDACKFCSDNQESSSDFTSCVCKVGFVAVGERCECAQGYTLENGLCKLCPAGRFKEVVGNGQCKSCDQHAVLNSFSTSSSIALALNQTVSPPISPENCSCAIGEYR